MSYPGNWTKVTSAPRTYVTEASTLSANGGNDVKCFECGRDVVRWEAIKGEEGETSMWVCRCMCGANYKVFND